MTEERHDDDRMTDVLDRADVDPAGQDGDAEPSPPEPRASFFDLLVRDGPRFEDDLVLPPRADRPPRGAGA